MQSFLIEDNEKENPSFILGAPTLKVWKLKEI